MILFETKEHAEQTVAYPLPATCGAARTGHRYDLDRERAR
jgi:hypothetical protein